jgi:hypothetical protein
LKVLSISADDSSATWLDFAYGYVMGCTSFIQA